MKMHRHGGPEHGGAPEARERARRRRPDGPRPDQHEPGSNAEVAEAAAEAGAQASWFDAAVDEGVAPGLVGEDWASEDHTVSVSSGLGSGPELLLGARGPALLGAWESVQSELTESAPEARHREAADLLRVELGQDVSRWDIHLDRPAWRVAADYSADAVVIDGRLYVAREVEELIVDVLYPPVIFGVGGSGQGEADVGPVREGGLIPITWRAPFLAYGDSAVVMTPGGYTVEMKDHEVIVYDNAGALVTRIWGDPHVDEGGGGDEWHFGQDSTFILPDGTKLCLDTEPNAVGEWYTVGVDVLSGGDRFHYGVGDEAGYTEDALEWDRAHADRAEDASAGVFALQDNGQWAIQAADGQFYDITNESWGAYLNDRDVDYDPALAASGLTAEQLAVAGDRDLTQEPPDARREEGGPEIFRYTSDVLETPAGLLERINPRGDIESWRLNTILLDLELSTPTGDRDHQLSKAAQVGPEVGRDLTGYEIRDDFVADRIARNARSDVVVLDGIAYLAAQIERQTLNIVLPTELTDGRGVDPALLEARPGFLTEILFKPSFCAYADSAKVVTHEGYTIEMKDHEVIVYDQAGALVTRIWGDPHVDEGGGGDEWHFGEDSTFLLPDGTKLCLDTEPNAVGEWYTVGVDVLCGGDRYHYGVGGEQGMTQDAQEWDLAHADRSEDASAGVFALQSNGQWAVQGNDGGFYDVNNESWADYLNDRDIDYSAANAAVGLTAAQLQQAGDADLKAQQEAAQARPVGAQFQRERFTLRRESLEVGSLPGADGPGQRPTGPQANLVGGGQAALANAWSDLTARGRGLQGDLRWRQVGGPEVQGLEQAQRRGEAARFLAPAVAQDARLRFEVVGVDLQGRPVRDDVAIPVQAHPPDVDAGPSDLDVLGGGEAQLRTRVRDAGQGRVQGGVDVGPGDLTWKHHSGPRPSQIYTRLGRDKLGFQAPEVTRPTVMTGAVVAQDSTGARGRSDLIEARVLPIPLDLVDDVTVKDAWERGDELVELDRRPSFLPSGSSKTVLTREGRIIEIGATIRVYDANGTLERELRPGGDRSITLPDGTELEVDPRTRKELRLRLNGDERSFALPDVESTTVERR